MKIEISTKTVLSVVGTIALGVTSWFALGHIEHGNRLSRLEDSDANDERQDRELAEIRATMRDIIRLSAELSGHDHGPAPLGPVVSLPDVAGGPPGHEDDHPDHAEAEEIPEEYGEFRHEQADLESILRGRGIEPAEKGLPDQ